jgi:hypothetical protein
MGSTCLESYENFAVATAGTLLQALLPDINPHSGQ